MGDKRFVDLNAQVTFGDEFKKSFNALNASVRRSSDAIHKFWHLSVYGFDTRVCKCCPANWIEV